MIDIQAAIESLRTGEESVRRRVVDELGRSGRPEAIPPLLMAVADESWPVRQAAAELLAAFDQAALLPPWRGRCATTRTRPCATPPWRSTSSSGPAGVPPLLALLHDTDEEVRNFAAVMLGGAPRGTARWRVLIEALDDADVNVRHAAAASLGQIGSPEAVPAAGGRSCARSRGCSTRPSTPWARSATPRRAARCSSCSTTSCCADR